MQSPYMTTKIEHATINVYFDQSYDGSQDEQDIQDAIKKGDITPSVIEVLVYDTTGEVTGSDILGGCLISEVLDVQDTVKEYDMIQIATDDMVKKVKDIVSIYHHLAVQSQK